MHTQAWIPAWATLMKKTAVGTLGQRFESIAAIINFHLVEAPWERNRAIPFLRFLFVPYKLTQREGGNHDKIPTKEHDKASEEGLRDKGELNRQITPRVLCTQFLWPMCLKFVWLITVIKNKKSDIAVNKNINDVHLEQEDTQSPYLKTFAQLHKR